MKSQAFFRRCFIALILTIVCLGVHQRIVAAPTNLFFTNFDTNYSTAQELVGQNSWVGYGSGGNGIVSNYFAGQRQQAFVGSLPPDPGDSLYVWRPINFNPIVDGLPIVKFSVLMRIADSDNGEYDYFRWSVYNIDGDRLFSIEFDNYWLQVNYELNGNSQIVTNLMTFLPDQDYTLNITMNFASNRWSATLDNSLIATNRAISTTSVPLNLGDVDAVWLLGTTNAGNNYMLFDNYQVTAEALTNAPVPPVPPAQVQFLRRTGEGWALLWVWGQNQSRWSLDATTNFVNWTPLRTNTIDGGYAEYVDMTAVPFTRRFYRARLVP